MRLTRIITAKIRPEIMELVSSGAKRFEVRMESFQDADFIRYVHADAPDVQFEDGLRRLGCERRFGRESDEFVRELSGVDDETFRELFPRRRIWSPATRFDDLYVAPIGEPVTLDQMFERGNV
ncbi:hypothetical protein BPY_22990 [Bifidobacterium psychraerophilum]|uniref:hypothetical protein n=1 Tax=Bifidobacterium psychraerophilum TaxID=218140 RepID=UPI00310F991C